MEANPCMNPVTAQPLGLRRYKVGLMFIFRNIFTGIREVFKDSQGGPCTVLSEDS
jgi:hypothetical protein